MEKNVNQLSLLTSPCQDSLAVSHASLLTNHSWENLVAQADKIEQEINNIAVYQQLGYTSLKEFLESLGKIKGDYIYAVKFIWWYRLVWGQKSFSCLKRDQFKQSKFVSKFPLIAINKKTGNLMLRQSQLQKALDTWILVKNRYGENVSYSQMEAFIEGAENPYAQSLEQKIEWLEEDLRNAKDGILSFTGIKAKNKEMPERYAELYCMALRTNMSALQLKYFADILILEGYYPACQYIDQFVLIA
jgi:hypothetical protein